MNNKDKLKNKDKNIVPKSKSAKTSNDLNCR